MTDKIDVLISEDEVGLRIGQIAEKINDDYKGKSLYIISILKGAVFFTVELARRLTVPVYMDFMQVSSYGDSQVSSGSIKIKKDTDGDIEGKDVLIIEDIIDTGYTLKYLKDYLLKRNPASLKLCALLDKPERRETEIDMDYTGFSIPDKFVVGYGLDYAQKYRNLPYIGVVELKED